jgi:hypothetical protein
LPQTRNRPSGTPSAASGIQRLLALAMLAHPPTRQRRVCGPSIKPDLGRSASAKRGATKGSESATRRFAERRRSAAAMQALVRYRCANAQARRSAPGKGWKLNRSNPRCLLRHQSSCRRTVAIWRNCDKPGPIGFVVGGFSGGRLAGRKPASAAGSSEGLAGRRVGGRPPRRERIGLLAEAGTGDFRNIRGLTSAEWRNGGIADVRQ